MIPSVVSTQLQRTVREYLATTFCLREPGYERALLDYLQDPETGLFRGPYLDVKLPFRRCEGASVPLEVRPPYDPYAHQLRAWERLSCRGQQPRSTLVATGTGSGKTECFLFPLLDLCVQQPGPGIKAIVLYPMNALASDQASRFARELHALNQARGTGVRPLRGGLYIGGDGTHAIGTPEYLVDKRQKLQEHPPDILLTNYRMLDFLLLRPRDNALWQHNAPGTLRYLVLDELHTYDGAQGTDVAFLIRRLKQRLGADKAEHRLCCVGTSATIGGSEHASTLREFAESVFDEPFEPGSIITEDRLAIAESLPALSEEFPVATACAKEADPDLYDTAEAYLLRQAQLWLGSAVAETLGPDPRAESWRVALGEQLQVHQGLRDLLTALRSGGHQGPRLWREVVARLPDDSDVKLARGLQIQATEPAADAPDDDTQPELKPADVQWLWLASLLGLVAHARKSVGGRVQPFLFVQVQLWLRELRRLLRKVPRTVGEPVAFAWHDDLQPEQGPHAVQVYCRECGDAGLGVVKKEGRDELYTAPEVVGEAYMIGADTARYLRIGATPEAEGQTGLLQEYLCPSTLRLDHDSKPVCKEINDEGVLVDVPKLEVVAHLKTSEKGKFLRDCPVCGADDSLTILGSRAASLSSVAVSHVFVSAYNRDRKLLAFTDSVQDASHRASFFAARTYRFVMRTAIQAVLDEADHDLPLAIAVDRLIEHWRAQLEGKPGRVGKMVATLMPADLRDHDDYKKYVEAIADPTRKLTKRLVTAVETLLRARLGWEVARELGLGVVIGRSLDRTGCATAFAEPNALAAAAKSVHLSLHERRPVALKGGGPSLALVRHYLAGLVERLRTRGGIHNELLGGYVKTGSPFFLSRRKNPRISRFGPRARLPRFAYHGPQHKVFDPLMARPTRRTWFRDFTARALQFDVRDVGINEVLATAIRHLADAGVVETRETKGPANSQPRATGLHPGKLLMTSRVARVACKQCGHSKTVAAQVAEQWHGARCLSYRCAGVYADTEFSKAHSYYRKVFKRGRIARVFAAEHTGLLTREQREDVELQFKGGPRPDAPNLLACTPTLEMGIDIGDLSAVMLSSVPPLTANYLQRVGRAGRSTGNSLVLTLALARPHDRYFFGQPEEMMRGVVEPPGCYLWAPEMLSRQLVAHAMDAWARDVGGVPIPGRMRDLLGRANQTGFPHAFYGYYEDHKFEIAARFMEAFRPAEQNAKGRVAWAAVKDGLETQIHNNEIPMKMREAFAAVALERDNLRKRIDVLRRRKGVVEQDPSKAHPHPDEPEKSAEHELAEINDGLRALFFQVEELGNKYPLNVLTDAGVLPNYAFPEPGVTLTATLLGAKPDEADAKDTNKANNKRRSRAKTEYLRPASVALREFAPFNRFYADGRKLVISQLDLGNAQHPTVEVWRFCPACSHCEPEKTDRSPEPQCPSCNTQWNDVGQLFPIIAFRRAWSSATALEASTADESDEREQESYHTVELIEVDPRVRGQAKLIEQADVVFGYEWVPRALLREVNFGRAKDAGGALTLAGQDVTQPGFMVCKTCGRVQPKHLGEDQPPVHQPWCKSRGVDKPDVYTRVGLYRQTASEAIRVLLPVANHEVGKVLNSVRAALELGFRRKFGGQPQHLKITMMREPTHAAHRQYLVIYDTVPGGTGYLSGLWRDDGLFEVLKVATEAMRHCPCARDDNRDGCYRCVYAYQHQRDHKSISRKFAVDLFGRVLPLRKSARDVPTLSEVSVDSIFESELERLFCEALAQAAQRRGWQWEETRFAGKPGYRMLLAPDLAWEVRMQVDLGPNEGVTHPCRPDFVLTPIGRQTESIAVFTDGFAYHAQPDKAQSRVADDIRKRTGILASLTAQQLEPKQRHRVWSLTWTDVQHALDQGPPGTPLLTGFPTGTFANFKQLKAADGTPNGLPRADSKLIHSDSFWLLIEWLAQPDSRVFRESALAAANAHCYGNLVAKQGVVAYQEHLQSDPKRAGPPEVASATKGQYFARRHGGHVDLSLAITRKYVKRADFGQMRVHLRLYDDHASRRAPDFEPAWRQFFQAWNLLQFHECVVTSSELIAAGGPAVEVVAQASKPTSEATSQSPRRLPRAELASLAEAFDQLEPLFVELSTRQLPAPIEPTSEFVLGGKAREVDLFWPDLKIAISCSYDESDLQAMQALGWQAFNPETEAEQAAVVEAITQRMGI